MFAAICRICLWWSSGVCEWVVSCRLYECVEKRIWVSNTERNLRTVFIGFSNIVFTVVFLKRVLYSFHTRTLIHETSMQNKYVTNCFKMFCCRKIKELVRITKLAPNNRNYSIAILKRQYTRERGIHGWMIKVCSNKKKMWFSNLCIFIVFSCPFSSTALAEDDEKVVKVDSNVSSMNQKWFVFYKFL